MRTANYQKKQLKGFTLIELSVVISIMMIITAITVPIYQAVVLRAREAVLHDNLTKMRDAIDKYTNDKNGAPPTLQDLVKANYFRTVPIDPITRTNDTWQVTMEQESSSASGRTGIRDVFSGAQGVSTEGTPYSEW